MKKIVLYMILGSLLHADSFSEFITNAINQSHELEHKSFQIAGEKASVEYTTVWKNPEIEIGFDDRIDNSMDITSFEVSQQLPSWRESSLVKSVTQAKLEKALSLYKSSKQSVMYDAAELYRKLYYQQELINTLDTQIEEVKGLLGIAKSRKENGDLSGIVHDRIAINLHKLQASYENEKNHYLDLELQAKRILRSESIAIDSAIEHDSFFSKKMVQKSLKHPNLQVLESELKRSKEEIALAKSRAYASPEIFAYHEREAGAVSGVNQIYGAGFRMSIPIFDSKRLDIEKKKIEKLSTEHELEYNTYLYEKEAQHYLKLYEQEELRLKNYDLNVLVNSKKLYEINKMLFSSGETSILEMLDAQELYFASELQRNKIYSNYDRLFLELCQLNSIDLLKDRHE
ncbi:TolC family protein [bacterium]|nr:TolC family protein [bacterium]MBU1990168.1 TolC family protein [bacterium]